MWKSFNGHSHHQSCHDDCCPLVCSCGFVKQKFTFLPQGEGHGLFLNHQYAGQHHTDHQQKGTTLFKLSWTKKSYKCVVCKLVKWNIGFNLYCKQISGTKDCLNGRCEVTSWSFFPLTQLPSGGSGCDSLGRERVKQFTYDHSYWSVEPQDHVYASQEKVGLSGICSQYFYVLHMWWVNHTYQMAQCWYDKAQTSTGDCFCESDEVHHRGCWMTPWNDHEEYYLGM